jgi:hypothetical protein
VKCAAIFHPEPEAVRLICAIVREGLGGYGEVTGFFQFGQFAQFLKDTKSYEVDLIVTHWHDEKHGSLPCFLRKWEPVRCPIVGTYTVDMPDARLYPAGCFDFWLSIPFRPKDLRVAVREAILRWSSGRASV